MFPILNIPDLKYFIENAEKILSLPTLEDYDRMETDKNGTKRYYLGDKLHRLDGPAIEYADGTKHWYINGEKHRVDGPAIERPDGKKYWYKNGALHRLDGPAVEEVNGDKFWFINGKRVTKPMAPRS